MTVIPQHPYAATTTSTSFDSFANLDKKFNKYNAFGQFIAASLADLSDEKATDVMQRITMEIFAAQRDLNWKFHYLCIFSFIYYCQANQVGYKNKFFFFSINYYWFSI